MPDLCYNVGVGTGYYTVAGRGVRGPGSGGTFYVESPLGSLEEAERLRQESYLPGRDCSESWVTEVPEEDLYDQEPLFEEGFGEDRWATWKAAAFRGELYA
jgi:hypothetical protein